MVIGIDPDSNGALAHVHLESFPEPDAQAIDALVRLYDIPCEILERSSRNLRCGTACRVALLQALPAF